MKKITFILGMFMFCITSSAQNIDTDNYNWELASAYTLELNTFIPVGNLSNTLQQSIGFGFYIGFPVDKKLRIDIGTSLFIPKEEKRIVYFTDNEKLEGGTALSGVLGVWLTKVKRINKKIYWDVKSGLGVGFFQTDIETGKPKEENDSVYGAETIFVNIGTAIRTSIFKSNIGLKLDYFFVPYNLFKKRFPSNFGMNYLTLGLTYGL